MSRPIDLHEKHPSQRGDLVEQWPRGLVIEVGSVPRGIVKAIMVHRHQRSLDFLRDGSGGRALVHPQRQDRDWWPARPGDPLFLILDGSQTLRWQPESVEPNTVWLVCINEAADDEEGIALSLTERDVWPMSAIAGNGA